MITGMLNNSGWHVNHKRPSRQICFANRLPGNGRADLAAGGAESATETTQEGSALVEPLSSILRIDCRAVDGSCVRLRPERPNHVWSYDFVQDRTHDGRVYRTLNIIDEFRRRRPLSAMQASPAGPRDDPCQTKAQFRRRGRRLDRPVHPARTAGIHKIRQWRRIYRKEGARLDRRGGSQDGLHRTRFTLGKRLLRELQRTVPRRTFEW